MPKARKKSVRLTRAVLLGVFRRIARRCDLVDARNRRAIRAGIPPAQRRKAAAFAKSGEFGTLCDYLSTLGDERNEAHSNAVAARSVARWARAVLGGNPQAIRNPTIWLLHDE